MSPQPVSHSVSPASVTDGTRHPAGNGSGPGTGADGDGLEHERRYVAMLYGRLDERRADTARRLQSVLHDETVGTPQALTERDAAAAMYTDRLATLRAAEHGLASAGSTRTRGSGATSAGSACSTRSTTTSRC